MPSFTQTLILAIAAAASVSASPVSFVKGDSVSVDSVNTNIEQRDIAVCWGKGAKGTDANYPAQPQCDKRVWTEDSFTAPFVLVGATANTMAISTDSHITFGPWHCCNTCKKEDGCIGWQYNADCSCVLWRFEGNDTSVLGVYGGPFTNQTGTFHRGTGFPAKPNLFGDSTINY